MSKSSTSILRVGSPDDRLAASLTDAVIGFLQQGKGISSTSIKISNKYFDAQVALKPLPFVEDSSTASSEGQEDGVLLVFSDTSKESFDVLAELHAKAESNAQNGDLLRLCIGVSTGAEDSTMSSKEREEEYSRRVLWCLDHGYEYVEKVDLSERGIQKGHQDKEKEGFARVMEAIQGTVWSSAKMHPKKKQTLTKSYQEAKTEVVPEENAYEPPPTTLPMPTSVVSEKEAKEREDTARQALLKQDGISTEQTDDSYIDGKAPLEEDRVREQKAEKITTEMEGALKEANRIRDMSRAGELSDEDRKKRAGDAATLLMNLMNQMGGMDSDSENEHNDDDSD